MNEVRAVISFLAVLVGAVSVVLIASFNSLITREENIRVAWERVQAVQNERRDLAADILHALDPGTIPAAALQQWRRAQSEMYDASDFSEEVRAQPAADSSFTGLVKAIREAAAGNDNDLIRSALMKLEDASRRLGVERRLYNEMVQDYRRHLGRIPTRWVAMAFGFGDLPEYVSDNQYQH